LNIMLIITNHQKPTGFSFPLFGNMQEWSRVRLHWCKIPCKYQSNDYGSLMLQYPNSMDPGA